ncbi:MAG: prepilin peptidase [Planctomycetia bacterium]|nr:prepilin peptidase [Planctomycetia bacterium]
MLEIYLPLMFVLGAVIGSFLNVCIIRLPLEKSLLWPLTSRCGACLQPIAARDNIPLISYCLLRGRCRTCGVGFSSAYFFVELLTGLGFAGLYYLVVHENVHEIPVTPSQVLAMQSGLVPLKFWIIYAHHAVLFSFLMIVSCCDLAQREIPLSVTFTGAAFGLVFSMLWPWPWPYVTTGAVTILPIAGAPWWMPPILDPDPPLGALQLWPLWWPLPAWLAPGGTWYSGLLDGLAGMLAGSLVLRGIRRVFSTGMGVEALGLGDADLMMMAGAFIGWQPIIIAFFVSVIPALFFGVVQWVRSGDNAMPFGPALAVGVLITCLYWNNFGMALVPLAFHWPLTGAIIGAGATFMFVSAVLLRFMRRVRGIAPEGN